MKLAVLPADSSKLEIGTVEWDQKVGTVPGSSILFIKVIAMQRLIPLFLAVLVMFSYLLVFLIAMGGTYNRAKGYEQSISENAESWGWPILMLPFGYMWPNILVFPLANAIMWGAVGYMCTRFMVRWLIK